MQAQKAKNSKAKIRIKFYTIQKFIIRTQIGNIKKDKLSV